jgi:tRNA-splicing ligase RtcB
MKTIKNVKINKWLVEPLSKNISRALDRLSNSKGVSFIAVMPDIHLSIDVCIGTVVATESQLYPQAVGNDIGCGMTAISFDCEADDLINERNAAIILKGMYQLIPSNRHSRVTQRSGLPDSLMQTPLSHKRLNKAKSRDGLVQFCTLGRGNHFLEFQIDEQGVLWLMVHSGSRAMGQLITDYHLGLAQVDKSGLKYIEAQNDEGMAYLNDLKWACSYAESNRTAMIDEVATFMKKAFGVATLEPSFISCNHNHLRLENHFDNFLYVHRKGALSAKNGEKGIIPGSMGTPSFHTEGREEPSALNSSSHGAGRTMSRSEARKKVNLKRFHQQMEGVWFDHSKGNNLLDESPSAYKNIRSVMRAQKGLTRIIRKLNPVINYKGI